MARKTASDYPQELLDLFHEYQHGDIDRRTFLERAGKFAVGGLTAAAILSEMKPNYAWAQQVPKDDARIKTEVVTVQSPQGNGSIKGLFARPAKAGGRLPGIIVIHENRGLNPYVEDVARRFAVANFIAYAPDGLTSVGGFPGNDEQGAVKFREVNGPKMMEDFVAAAAESEDVRISFDNLRGVHAGRRGGLLDSQIRSSDKSLDPQLLRSLDSSRLALH